MATKQKPEELEHKLPFDPPSLEFAEKITAPLFKYFTPEFYGLENVDSNKPTLFVNNHTVFGLFDGPMFGVYLYREKGMFLRALADNIHFEIPVWRDMLRMVMGAVQGTRQNCADLMEQGQHILVYPGGGREVCKRKGEKYKLTWKSRTGFARMAIEHGYQIIPLAGMGGDDTYEILFDAEDIMGSKIGDFLKSSGIAQKFLKGGDHIPPITRGIGPTLFPKPVKFYYAFGEPIDTTRFAGKADDKEVQMQVRKEVELSMNKMFVDLMEKRDADVAEMSPIRRFLTRF